METMEEGLLETPADEGSLGEPGPRGLPNATDIPREATDQGGMALTLWPCGRRLGSYDLVSTASPRSPSPDRWGRVWNCRLPVQAQVLFVLLAAVLVLVAIVLPKVNPGMGLSSVQGRSSLDVVALHPAREEEVSNSNLKDSDYGVVVDIVDDSNDRHGKQHFHGSHGHRSGNDTSKPDHHKSEQHLHGSHGHLSGNDTLEDKSDKEFSIVDKGRENDSDDDDEEAHAFGGGLVGEAEGLFQGIGGWFGWATGQAALAMHLMTQTSTTTTQTTTSTATTTTRTTTTVTTTTVTTSTSTITSTTITTTTSSTMTSTITSTTTVLTTLFCWEVVRPDGYEPPLVRGQWDNKASAFACEDYAIYSHGGTVEVGSFVTKEIKLPKNQTHLQLGDLSKAGTTTTSWLNTRLFIKAWAMVLEDGRWWNHDWTIKIDPDAVFFPHRLKVALYNFYSAGDFSGPALFVANCDRSWNNEPYSLKLFGSMEVISRNALGVYNARAKECTEDLDWKGWGEDFFMQSCLKMLGVGVVNGVGFLADNRCHYAPCTDTSKVTYHDFKEVHTWFDCWGQSHAKEEIEEKAREDQMREEWALLTR